MRHTISNSKPLTVRATFLDESGQPAAVDGEVRWTSSDHSIATVAAHRPDSSVATVSPVGPAGSVDITAAADARIGSGVRRVTTTTELSVTAGEAVAGVITPVFEGHVGGGPTPPGRPTDPDYGVSGDRPSTGPVPPGRPVDPGYGRPEGGGGHPDHDLPGERPPTVGGGPITPPNRPVAPDQPPGGPGRPVAPDQPPGSPGRPVAPDQPPPPVAGHPLPDTPEAGHPLPPHKPDEPPAKPKKRW